MRNSWQPLQFSGVWLTRQEAAELARQKQKKVPLEPCGCFTHFDWLLFPSLCARKTLESNLQKTMTKNGQRITCRTDLHWGNPRSPRKFHILNPKSWRFGGRWFSFCIDVIFRGCTSVKPTSRSLSLKRYVSNYLGMPAIRCLKSKMWISTNPCRNAERYL